MAHAISVIPPSVAPENQLSDARLGRTGGAVAVQRALVGLGVEDSVGVDRQSAIDGVPESHLDDVPHGGPQYWAQVTQVGIFWGSCLHERSMASCPACGYA